MRLLYDPLTFVPRAVEGRRWAWPLLALVVASVLSGAAQGVRFDATRVVLPRLEAAGELAKASEREVAEAVQQAERIALVGGVARGVVVMPLWVLLVAVALKLVAWLLGRRLLFNQAFTVAAVAMVPIAVFHLLFAAVAFKQDVIVASDAAGQLVPSSLSAWVADPGPTLHRLYDQLDFFSLWSALLLGLGFAAGTRLQPGRGVAVGLVLYVAFAVVAASLPGLSPAGVRP